MTPSDLEDKLVGLSDSNASPTEWHHKGDDHTNSGRPKVAFAADIIVHRNRTNPGLESVPAVGGARGVLVLQSPDFREPTPRMSNGDVVRQDGLKARMRATLDL